MGRVRRFGRSEVDAHTPDVRRGERLEAVDVLRRLRGNRRPGPPHAGAATAEVVGLGVESKSRAAPISADPRSPHTGRGSWSKNGPKCRSTIPGLTGGHMSNSANG